MKRIIEKMDKLNGKEIIKLYLIVFFILIFFLALLPNLSNIKEVFSKNNVFYFPVKDKEVPDYIKNFLLSKERTSYTITAIGFLKVENSKIARQLRTILVKDRAIRDTLEKVAKKFEAEEDANGDRKTNCQDAALWFYFLYPYREEVEITCNSVLKHAFITVKMGNRWNCIEPQAFLTPKESTYFMEDLWWPEYNPVYNFDGTFLIDDYYNYLIFSYKKEE